MRFRRILLLGCSAASSLGLAAEDSLDRLDEALTFSSADASIRTRLSGTLDLEGYLLQQPAPGLIYSMGRTLFNPRLTLFLDAQLGPHVYVFAQSRLDRGFDPGDWDARMRLDEYAGRGIGNYRENVIGQDISFQWRHWQLWAEFYEARFEVPGIGNADTIAYYIEAKYKFTPQCFAALRWNQQFFSTVPDGEGGRAPWVSDKWRLDLAVACRFTLRTQLKLQYSIEEGDAGIRDYGHLFAAQFTVRF